MAAGSGFEPLLLPGPLHDAGGGHFGLAGGDVAHDAKAVAAAFHVKRHAGRAWLVHYAGDEVLLELAVLRAHVAAAALAAVKTADCVNSFAQSAACLRACHVSSCQAVAQGGPDPALQKGQQWLQAQTKPDGSLASEAASPALPAQSRHKTVAALKALNASVPATLIAGMDGFTAPATRYLAQRAGHGLGLARPGRQPRQRPAR